jgi:hypothetical protein
MAKANVSTLTSTSRALWMAGAMATLLVVGGCQQAFSIFPLDGGSRCPSGEKVSDSWLRIAFVGNWKRGVNLERQVLLDGQSVPRSCEADDPKKGWSLRLSVEPGIHELFVSIDEFKMVETQKLQSTTSMVWTGKTSVPVVRSFYVTSSERIVLNECSQEKKIRFNERKQYFVSYLFGDDHSCSLSCLEWDPKTQSRKQAVPCSLAP